jgi:hypothetical protein
LETWEFGQNKETVKQKLRKVLVEGVSDALVGNPAI